MPTQTQLNRFIFFYLLSQANKKNSSLTLQAFHSHGHIYSPSPHVPSRIQWFNLYVSFQMSSYKALVHGTVLPHLQQYMLWHILALQFLSHGCIAVIAYCQPQVTITLNNNSGFFPLMSSEIKSRSSAVSQSNAGLFFHAITFHLFSNLAFLKIT